MSTRQYIGARYVPKFAEPFDWSSARRYEALEIVYHLGACYTSKIPVPVGVDITDTKYWVCTGNYNAQVEEFRNETARLMADYISLLRNGEKLIGKSWITNPTTIAPGGAILRNPNRVLVIGDSYNDEGRTQYATYGVTTWGRHLQELLGFNADSYKTIGVSGAGWSIKGSSHDDDTLNNHSFGDIVRQLYTPENVYDKVIIVGGLNDIIRDGGDLSVVTENIENTVNYIKTINKNTDVYIGVCGYTFDEYQYKKKDLVNNICSANAPFVFLSGVEYCAIGKRYLLNDFTHPTNEAEKIIAKAIYTAINGNKNNYSFSKTYTIKSKYISGTAYPTAMVINTVIDNDIFRFSVFDVAPNLTNYYFVTPSGLVSTLEINEVEGYEFTSLTSSGSGDLPICTTNVRAVITNPVVHKDGHYIVGDILCDLVIRWYLKSVISSGKVEKTMLYCDISGFTNKNGPFTYHNITTGNESETNGYLAIRGGTFKDAEPMRTGYHTSMCSVLSV